MPVDRQLDDPIEPFGCRVENVTAAKEKDLGYSDEQGPKEPHRPQLGVGLEAIEGIPEEHLGGVYAETDSQFDEGEPNETLLINEDNPQLYWPGNYFIAKFENNGTMLLRRKYELV